ncbi:alpha/beta fold hydrolase [Paenibacillus cineris]|uniref:alpha/beta fold hydrolase n=1 Tax=Paenibacillus cineris TaxID=237530 RepID=UPI001B207A61|nr:alpha/beta hydrolase [Paenibacillus cineris]GIO64813.1 alpha/beta hydrolase [Paenibacillus cineris]
MRTVASKDGTSIAYDKVGSGPPLLLVDGALCSRGNGPSSALAAALQQDFTVYTYDRRGRGESGDHAIYGVDREIEDLSAVIEEAGEDVFVYGVSSGAALALEAANQLSSIKKLALYEAPFVTDGSREAVPDEYAAQMDELIRANRRGAAVKLFMRKGVGLPAPVVAMMPMMPAWSKLKSVAHTLPYDTILTIGQQKGSKETLKRWSSVSVPTLVAVGGKSPEWMRNSMKELAQVLPNATHQVLPGQTHIVKPAALVPVLVDYLKG